MKINVRNLKKLGLYCASSTKDISIYWNYEGRCPMPKAAQSHISKTRSSHYHISSLRFNFSVSLSSTQLNLTTRVGLEISLFSSPLIWEGRAENLSDSEMFPGEIGNCCCTKFAHAHLHLPPSTTSLHVVYTKEKLGAKLKNYYDGLEVN